MSYKVLNLEGEKIVVKEINPQIHRHLSGREFTENDACVKAWWKIIEKREKAVDSFWDKDVNEMSREQAIEAYKEKYGRKPNWMMKTENIIAKL